VGWAITLATVLIAQEVSGMDKSYKALSLNRLAA
jgi:hypothetical protein